MASVVAENWEYLESQLPQDDFESSLELSHVNQGFLMSLLDETQVDDCDDDDERLSKVIQSLEAEISPGGSRGSDDWNDESGGQDWPISPQDLDDHNKWMDVDFVPSGDWSLENSHEQWPINASGTCTSGSTVLDDQWPNDEIHFVSSVVNDDASSFF